MANSLNLYSSFYRNPEVQKESESQKLKRLDKINNPNFQQTRFGRITGAFASMLSLNGGGSLSAIRSVIPKCNSQYDGMKQFLENVEVTRTHGIDQLKLKAGVPQQKVAYRKWGQFMPGNFGAKTYGDIIQKVNESLLIQHQGRHYALPRLSKAVERRVFAQGGFYEGKAEQKLSSLQTILRKELLNDLNDAQKAKTISSGFLMIGVGAGIGAAVSLGPGALIGGLAGFGALMASAGGATLAYKHMEQELTDKMREIPFTHNTDDEQSAAFSSSSSDSSPVDYENLEQGVYRDNQSLNSLHSQTNIKNTEVEGSDFRKKVDRLVPMMECAHDLNMLLAGDIKGKGSQDLSALKAHCIQLLETQTAETSIDRALLQFLNGQKGFNGLYNLQQLVLKEMQNNELMRVSQPREQLGVESFFEDQSSKSGLPTISQSVSNPKTVRFAEEHESIYQLDSDQFSISSSSSVENISPISRNTLYGLSAGNKSTVSLHAVNKSNSIDEEFENLVLNYHQDTIEPRVLLKKLNQLSEQFNLSIFEESYVCDPAYTLDNANTPLDEHLKDAIFKMVSEAPEAVSQKLKTAIIQALYGDGVSSSHSTPVNQERGQPLDSVLSYMHDHPIDCSYLVKYLEQFTQEYNLGSLDQFISPNDKHKSIEQNNPELLLSLIRQMFDKIGQQSQAQSNKFKAELSVAFTASQLEID
ncbi:MAG: hypothetical protein VX185_01605 [Pseudomonadota bacterium]|nr:hypothetical protein [Gammaproteobacteria bacterium]MEC8009450.1 hypothetical protein [Pseudomonadota bacterium]HBF08487.1 hypothetical protein [Gammaproteobacteria bacterium]|tara:strand:+ start:30936 stop:33029 length:2094 start_codon:yes stop_codon:yes gene_type:complete